MAVYVFKEILHWKGRLYQEESYYQTFLLHLAYLPGGANSSKHFLFSLSPELHPPAPTILVFFF